MAIIDREPQTMDEERDKYCRHIPDLFHGSYRRSYRKAMKGHSLREAVNSKCLDCTCWQQAEVKDCPLVTCTLHPYRPYKAGSCSQSVHHGVDKIKTQEIRNDGSTSTVAIIQPHPRKEG